jgi:hypothetical protein
VRTAIVAGDIEVTWTGADGKPRATVPAAVKQKHAARLKELQGVHKQIRTALSAHRDRIERLLLARRTIPLSTWRTCYVDHPVVGAIARRLIWSTDDTSFVAQGGELRDSASRAMKVESDAPVALWHPVGRPVGEVLAWRERLEALGVSQPFKQAHREVYLLTDAERRTATYSNRFAAHVLRQHQFHALAGQRGWRYTLMGTWDSHNTPELVLPKWGVRVEFWLDSAGGGTSPSGVFLHVSTDQVRFLATDADAARRLGHTGGVDRPLRLDRVPPLLFSEVMRDVDLFVGVASVGNDPAWQDGGPGGAFRTYWHEYSFGDLSENAKTRRAVLERLVPRLKIADRASLTDRFLVVRGDVRTYKIHLGSGNILMEPNDQYLCIVPDQSGRARGDDGVFLPFEGDATLSVILSKAFLLADDARITDKTITSQIRR